MLFHREKISEPLTGYSVSEGVRVPVNASLPEPEAERPILSENTGIVFPRILFIPGTNRILACDYSNHVTELPSDWYVEPLKDGTWLLHQPADFRASGFDTGFAYHSGVHTRAELDSMKAKVLQNEAEAAQRAAIPAPPISEEERLRRENEDLKRQVQAAKATG